MSLLKRSQVRTRFRRNKAAQKEWTRIEGMIQSEFEQIIQETHAVEKAAQEASILAERTET